MNSTRVPWRFRLNKLAVQITLLMLRVHRRIPNHRDRHVPCVRPAAHRRSRRFHREHNPRSGRRAALRESQCRFSALSRRSLRQYRDPGDSPTGGGLLDGRRRSRLRQRDSSHRSRCCGKAQTCSRSPVRRQGITAFSPSNCIRAAMRQSRSREHQKSPGSIWRWLWQHADDEPFIVTPGARTALSFIIFTAIFVFWALNAIMAPLRRLGKIRRADSE